MYAVLLIAGPGDAFSTEAGKIVTVRKDVYVTSGDNRVKAEVRHPLVKGDSVETGKASRAKILFADDSILSLGEMSRVEVDENERHEHSQHQGQVSSRRDQQQKKRHADIMYDRQQRHVDGAR